MKILGLSGSLRRASLNSALLRAAQKLAEPPCVIHVYDSLGTLPLFNPDLEASPPHAVQHLRQAVDAAHALMIASPEYAHGVSGPMKNALDWLVSHEGFVAKPIALLNASARAHHAYEALAETLRTMSANLISEASLTVPLLGSGLDEHTMIGNPEVGAIIRAAVENLARAVRQHGAAGPHFSI